jgi:NAD(P)-dependent dehydrogenase (short-subunit alcohol dehydrogenase family)
MNDDAASALLGKRVLIIGGTSGIGEAIARQATQAGATVTVTGRDGERLARAAEQPWVTSTAHLDAHNDVLLDDFFAELSPIDHVVSMVGDSMAGGFLETTPETMRHVWHSKFWTNWQVARHAARVVRAGGSMTFTTGTGGRPHEISATYIANLSVQALVEGLAAELAPGVRVNAVAPTFMGTRTRFWSDASTDDLQTQEANFARSVPLQRLATVDEVASTYLHLMTNAYTTGQVVAVDGGVMLHK